MKPLVSIIIPSYNAGVRLVPCIKSCLAQSYENLEIILVDNNSTDGSIEEASRLLEPNAIRSKIVRCTEQGSMPSRVMGFEHSEGEFIQLLDADDELLSEKIAVQMAQFEVSVGVDVVYGDWEWRFLRDDGSYSALHFKSDNYSDYLLRLLANEWRPPICFLTRRKVMAAVYPEYIKHKIKINEDRLSISLVAAVGAVFRYAPGAVSIYNNWSSGQETKNISQDEMAAANRDIFAAIAEHLDQSRIEMSAMHRTLLNLSWNLVELGEVDIEKDGETFFVRLEKGAERVELSAAEKNLIVALGGCQGGQTIEAYSYLLLRRLIRMIAPRGDEEFGLVMAKLSAVLGLASGVDGRGRDGWEGFESQVLANSNLKQLLAGPLYMPILTKERMRVVEIMDRLLSIGVLVESARGECGSAILEKSELVVKRVAFVCAFPPRSNPGMLSVDLATSGVLSGVEGEVEVAYFCTEQTVQYTYSGGEHRYELYESVDQLVEFDRVIFWGDFLHWITYANSDFYRRSRRRDPEKSYSEILDQWYKLLLLEGASLELKRRVVCFGGTIYGLREEQLSNRRYHEALSSLYRESTLVLMRDVFSAGFVSQLTQKPVMTFGCDCALFYENVTNFPYQANPELPENYALCSFGRSGAKQLSKVFAKHLARLAGVQLIDLAWFGKPMGVEALHNRLSVIKRAKFVVTDIYHVSVNSLREGVPVLCIGKGGGRVDGSLSDKKKEVFFRQHLASDYYIYLEELHEAVRRDEDFSKFCDSYFKLIEKGALFESLHQRLIAHREQVRSTLLGALNGD